MATRLGADGCVEAGPMVVDDCCPPPLCGPSVCNWLCSFINLLPQGPMWDYWKRKAIDYYQKLADIGNPCEPLCPPALECPSLVYHAIYTVFKLRDLLQSTLWQVIRESNPSTAETTVDDWLERLGWEDCYNQHCRSALLGELTPYEVMSECGPVYCPPPISDELQCAVNRAILIALARVQMGVIKNQCSINWVIEPLGARLQGRNLPICNPDPDCNETCDDNCPDCLEFEICNTSDEIDACLTSADACTELTGQRPKIQAWFEYGCDAPAGLPEGRIYPGVIAAECIVRSLLPKACPNRIYRCCMAIPEPPVPPVTEESVEVLPADIGNEFPEALSAPNNETFTEALSAPNNEEFSEAVRAGLVTNAETVETNNVVVTP